MTDSKHEGEFTCIYLTDSYKVGSLTGESRGVFKWAFHCTSILVLQNDLKGAFTAQSKELAQKRKLEQMKMKSPHNRQQIVSFLHSLATVCCVGVCNVGYTVLTFYFSGGCKDTTGKKQNE